MHLCQHVYIRFNQTILYELLELILEKYHINVSINSILLTPIKWNKYKKRLPSILGELNCGQIITFVKFFDVINGLNLYYTWVCRLFKFRKI